MPTKLEKMKTKKQIDRDKKYTRLISTYCELNKRWVESGGSRYATVWIPLERRYGYSTMHIQRILAKKGIDYKCANCHVPDIGEMANKNDL